MTGAIIVCVILFIGIVGLFVWALNKGYSRKWDEE
jgi:hypothetical protein